MKKELILFFIIPFLAFACGPQEKEEFEKYSIEQFMDNTSVFGSSFSPNEEKILFTSNKSGVYNAYEMRIGEDSATQLTQREESTYALSYFPNDERLLLSSDKGGNELYHIYLRDKEGNIKDLTPYKEARSSFSGWSRDRESFFFTSNKRDKRYMDLYEMPLESMKQNMMFKNTEGYNIGPVSNDKSKIALTKTITN